MAKQVFSNFASCYLGSAISVTSAIASITLQAGKGALFPSPSGGDFFVACLLKADNSAIELFKITSRTGDVLTVDTRAYDGSTAATWSTADIVKCVVNAGALSDFNALIAALQSAMTTAEADIDNLQSDVATLQAQMAQKPRMDAGTKAVFCQAAAPTGWTLDTAANDRVLRVSSSAGGGTGGNWTISGITVDGTALSLAQLPPHTHGMKIFANGGTGASKGMVDGPGTDAQTDSAGSGATHSHTLTIGNSWRPAYLDTIVCSRN